jgi:predicted dienelactone hydrolase
MRLLAVLLALFVTLGSRAALAESEVGFQHLRSPEGVEIGVWYPSSGKAIAVPLGIAAQTVVPGGPVIGTALPLVVISHGTGGFFGGHTDTALALAKAGFVVAALTHPGDTWNDTSRAAYIEDRPRALSALIDLMVGTWSGHAKIDPARIGAFGFSAGGFTVLAAAGGVADLTRVRDLCAVHPDRFECGVIAGRPLMTPTPWSVRPDPRIKAIVVAAPALGYTFAGGLRSVRIPVQLWRADEDCVLPAPDYADAVRRALPRPPEFHSVLKAGHFDFLAPCDTPMHAEICASAPGFDRAAFHRAFNAELVRFFEQSLRTR